MPERLCDLKNCDMAFSVAGRPVSHKIECPGYAVLNQVRQKDNEGIENPAESPGLKSPIFRDVI
jgi:hypothetical protein